MFVRAIKFAVIYFDKDFVSDFHVGDNRGTQSAPMASCILIGKGQHGRTFHDFDFTLIARINASLEIELINTLLGSLELSGVLVDGAVCGVHGTLLVGHDSSC